MELDSFSRIYDGSSSYQFDNQIILEQYPKQVLTKFPGRGSILELGLGHGFSAQAFSGKFDSHTIIEGSLNVIQQQGPLLRERGIEVIHSYFEDYSTKRRFDLIVAGFVLEHVTDPEFIITKYLKLLNPLGILMIAVPNSASLNRRIGLHAGLIQDLSALSDHDRELGHLRYFDRDSLLEVIQRAEGRLDFVEGIFLKVASSFQLQNLRLEERVIKAYCQVAIDYPELSCALLAGVRAKDGA